VPASTLRSFATRATPRIDADTLLHYSYSHYEDVVWRLRPAHFKLAVKSAIFTEKADIPAKWVHPLIDWLPIDDTGTTLYASALLIERSKSDRQAARAAIMKRSFARVSAYALGPDNAINNSVKMIANTYMHSAFGKPTLISNDQVQKHTRGLFDSRTLRFLPQTWMSAKQEPNCPVVWAHHYAGSRVDRTTVGGDPAMFHGLADHLIWGISAPEGKVREISNRAGGKPPPLPKPMPVAW